MANQQVPPGGRLTPEQLHAFFVATLNGRAQAPSLEDCVDLAGLAGHGRLARSREGGLYLSDDVKAKSIAFRNKLPEAENYWRSVCEFNREAATNDIEV